MIWLVVVVVFLLLLLVVVLLVEEELRDESATFENWREEGEKEGESLLDLKIDRLAQREIEMEDMVGEIRFGGEWNGAARRRRKWKKR